MRTFNAYRVCRAHWREAGIVIFLSREDRRLESELALHTM